MIVRGSDDWRCDSSLADSREDLYRREAARKCTVLFTPTSISSHAEAYVREVSTETCR